MMTKLMDTKGNKESANESREADNEDVEKK
jgi:hypothetical protein